MEPVKGTLFPYSIRAQGLKVSGGLSDSGFARDGEFKGNMQKAHTEMP